MVTCIIQPILILLKLHIQTHTQSTHFVFFLDKFAYPNAYPTAYPILKKRNIPVKIATLLPHPYFRYFEH
jgi:hypothetical protein